jgi:translation initiation factor IF-1
MLAKLTTKNQLTLPKAVTQLIGPAEYFDVQARDGQIVLTPVRIQRGDMVRVKLAALDLAEGDIRDAVTWARKTSAATVAARPAKARTPKPLRKA